MIDFSDIPELFDKQLSRMRPVGRPTVGDEPRKLIAIRLSTKVSGRQRLEASAGPTRAGEHDNAEGKLS